MKKILKKIFSLGMFCIFSVALTVTASAQGNIKPSLPGFTGEITAFSGEAFSMPRGSSKTAQNDIGKQLTFSPYFKLYTDYSPDGNWITYAQGNDDELYDVWIVPADGNSTTDVSSAVNLTADIQASCFYPVFTPDSQNVLFTQWDNQGYSLWDVNIQTKEPRLARNNAGYGSISKTGRYLAYRTGDTGTLMIDDKMNIKTWEIDADGHYGLSCFTPDDAFVITTRSDNTLWMIPVAGGEPEQITPADGAHWFPDLSPGSPWLMFTVWPVEFFVDAFLVAYNMQTGDFIAPFPEMFNQNYCGSFSQDGSRIAYLQEIDGVFQVFDAPNPFGAGPEPGPHLFLDYPNGGENVTAGTTHDITWTSSGISAVLIEYSTDGGSSWETVVESVDAILGMFSCVIPDTPSSECLIRISDKEGLGLVDVSDATFSIISGAFEPELLFKYDTLDWIGQSAAIGSDGTIYIGSGQNLFAINPYGSLKWEYPMDDWIGSSPAIDSEGIIYIVAGNSLYAINPDGSLEWKSQELISVFSSPAVGNDGTIYIASYENYVYAINPDGSLKWEFKEEDPIEPSKPIVDRRLNKVAKQAGVGTSSVTIGGDGTIYHGSCGQNVYAINPDGSFKWKYNANLGGWAVSSPAIDSDGTIYVGSGDNNLYAINPDGSLKWEYQTDNWIDSSPSIGDDGTIYIGSWDGNLYAINTDGSHKWKYQTDGGIVSSPAIGSDGTIYIGSWDDSWFGYLYALNSDGSLKWRYSADTEIMSSPSIDNNGIIYFGSGNYLYAIDSGTGAGLADTPWPKYRHDLQNTGRASRKPSITFNDQNLEAAIREALNKPEWPITEEDLAGLTELKAPERGISDLTGIEHCVNLQILGLNHNQISDLSPLSSLTNLHGLYLYSNQISDLSPLSSLTNLDDLGLGENQISNLSPLSSLTNLDNLGLDNNQISDLSPLSNMTNLQSLHFEGNQISDLSPLSSLTNLVTLSMGGNQISDISPLSSLTNLNELNLDDNRISDISSLSNLNNLHGLWLHLNQISDISPLSTLTYLRYLYLDVNQISDISPLSSLTNLQNLHIGGNQISDFSPLSGLTNLENLELNDTQISDLSPLVNLTNLRALYLDNNQIQDISPLAGLEMIGEMEDVENEREGFNIHLGLSNNLINDIRPLVNNTGIGDGDGIDLRGNTLSNEALTGVQELLDRGANILYGADVQITVTSPNGGEVWEVGSKQIITWEAADVPQVNIQYSLDGINYMIIEKNVDAASGSYEWIVPPLPAGSTGSDMCFIRIIDSSNFNIRARNPSAFTIQPSAVAASIELVFPKAGDQWAAGSHYEIRWQSTGVSRVYIEYSIDGGNTYNPIVDDYDAGLEALLWLIPDDIESTECFIRIVDSANEAVDSENEEPFTIFVGEEQAHIEVFFPNGGETLLAGTDVDIVWYSTGIEEVRIYLSTQGGEKGTWQLITRTVASAGWFTWTVPDSVSNNCIIRIIDVANVLMFDDSNEPFSIAPNITNENAKFWMDTVLDEPGSQRNTPVTGVGGGELVAFALYGIDWAPPNRVAFNMNWDSNFATFRKDASYFRTFGQEVILNGVSIILPEEINILNMFSTDVDENVQVLSPGYAEGSLVNNQINEPYLASGLVFLAVFETASEFSSGDSLIVDVSMDIFDDQGSKFLGTRQFRAYAKDAYVNLIAPEEGDRWAAGSTHTIQWETKGVTELWLAYSTKGWETTTEDWIEIYPSIDATQYNSYDWEIPGGVESTECIIGIVALDVEGVVSLSDLFSIYVEQQEIRLVSPNGGQEWLFRDEQEIVWTSGGISLINIEYSDDGGTTWNTIVSNVDASAGSYTWTIPNAPSEDCLVRISDAGNSSLNDASDIKFTISSGDFISIKEPSEGQVWSNGIEYEINWNFGGAGNIKIELSTDGGLNWEVIVSSVPASDASYKWTVPDDIESTECIIKLTDVSVASLNDESAVFSIMKPQIVIVHEPLAEEEQNAELTFTAEVTSDSGIKEVKIYYDDTGDREFNNELDMEQTDGDNYEAILEEGRFTALGMEYYITALDFDGKQTRAPVDSESFYTVTALAKDIGTEWPVPAGSEENSYRMVSIPLVLKSTDDIETQLADWLPTGEIGVDWRIFRYSPVTKTYDEYPDIEEGFAPGKAFWIIAKKGYDFSVPQGTTVSTAESFRLDLKSGWNDIANPWMFDISWDDIVDPSGAKAEGKISVLFSYEDKWSDPTDPPKTMEPWKGYAVENLSNRTIIVKLMPKPVGVSKPVIDTQPADWKITIRATVGLAEDSANHLGVRTDASIEWDLYDHVEPPPVGQYVSVLFPHRDWVKYPYDYTVDFRPPEETMSWDFNVKTNISREKVFVELNGIDDLPDGYAVKLIDRESGKPVDISGNVFDFVSGNSYTERRFTLFVSSDGEIEQPGTDAQPEKFVTATCYPNPFNPQTTIRYELSQPGSVKLSIFNALGQKVHKFDLGYRGQGIYEFVFDAGELTTGLYIYRVDSGYAAATGKMLFMK